MNRLIFQKLIRLNDVQVQHALEHQILDGGRNDGGVVDPFSGLATASHGGTAAYMASMTAALYTAESAYYRNAQVCEALEKAAQFMLRRQHEDGTISLGSTNFNSPPDTAFVVNGMAQIYTVLSDGTWEKGMQLAEQVKAFLQRAMPAMLTGGGHTPNHRWVLTAALSCLYRIFGDERLRARAEEWLAEGLDCTADGEWTERSNGIYNAVTNIMFIYSSINFNKPELLEPVRKNLEMMAYLVFDDGEVVTDYSGRQDWGARHNVSEYFLCYQWMAEHDQNPLFAAMYDLAVETLTHLGPVNNHALLGSICFPCPNVEHVPRIPLPDNFKKVLNVSYPLEQQLQQMETAGHHGIIHHSSMHTSFGAPVVRYKEGERSALLMSGTPSFFSLRNGEAKLLAVSLATTFSPGIVPMENFAETEQGCTFSTTQEKGYYGPLPAEHLPASASAPISPWYLLPHHQRPYTHAQQHTFNTEIIKGDNEWLIRIQSDERQDVVTQLTLLFPRNMQLSGSGLEKAGEDIWLWSGEELIGCSGSDSLKLSGGAKQHKLVHLRNTIGQGDAQKVIVNLVTPFVYELKISL